MNKDMINIDDFVREKLGGHTEKEDPAAWLRMKALLDKEMPEKAVPFVFRWGKSAAFLGAALLIGALCVGGYKLSAVREKSSVAAGSAANTKTIKAYPHSNNNNSNNRDNENQVTNNENSSAAPESLSPNTTSAAGTQNAVVGTNPAAGHTASNGNSSTAGTQSTPEAGKSTYAGKKRDQVHTGRNGISTAKTKAGHTAVASATQTGQRPDAAAPVKTEPAHNRGTRNALASNAKVGKADHASGVTTAGTKRKNKAAQHHGTAEAKKSPGTNNLTVFNSAAAKHNKELDGKGKQGLRDNAAAKPVNAEESHDLAKNKDAAKNTATANSEDLKDSISAISVVTRESTSRGGYPKKIIRITDTIAITKIALTEPKKTVNNTIVSNVQPSRKAQKLAASESRKANRLASKNEAESQKNILAAANKVEVKENSNSNASREIQSVVKVKKEKSAFSQWLQNLNLPEAVASAKQDFNSAQFYWGFNAGVNYSFPNGSGNFQGVQFGPTGELVFNKHWSLFGAVKYFNRSGSKKVVNDNFSRQIADQDSTQGANWFFTARTDSTNRYFNFSTVHSFEMPVTLRYTIRKFYLMTGINLAYYLPVNVEKVEREYNNMNVHVITTNSTKPILNATDPALNISDFGSRFGVGYVFGAGYQITPAWQTDLRVTNLLWDNAKGEGAQKLSKDFYRLPSVQLSFGYQFNRIRSRATFGPNSAP